MDEIVGGGVMLQGLQLKVFSTSMEATVCIEKNIF